jgi:hypothetical protein
VRESRDVACELMCGEMWFVFGKKETEVFGEEL